MNFDIFKPKTPPLFGLDISSSSVKMLEIAQSGKRGFWAREGRSYINVETVYPDLKLSKLSIYEVAEDGALVVKLVRPLR